MAGTGPAASFASEEDVPAEAFPIQPPSRPLHAGRFDLVRDGMAEGWAFSPVDPDQRVRVEIRAGDRLLAVGFADRFRPDLLRSGFGDGRHAFRIPLPSDLPADDVVELTARVAGEEHVLLGSPIRFCPAEAASQPPRPAYRGFLERVADGRAEGWACATADPGERVAVELLSRGEVIATAVADRMRDDLRTSGIGDGRYGFSIDLPLGLPPQAFPLTARIGGSDFVLPIAPGGKRMPEGARATSADPRASRHIRLGSSVDAGRSVFDLPPRSAADGSTVVTLWLDDMPIWRIGLDDLRAQIAHGSNRLDISQEPCRTGVLAAVRLMLDRPGFLEAPHTIRLALRREAEADVQVPPAAWLAAARPPIALAAS